MSELRAIVEAARAERAAGRSFLMATVVGVRGSAYRRAGARMLAADDRLLAGSISGGCLEREVLTRGAYLTRAGPCLATYDAGDALDDYSGSGCQGIIDYLIERCAQADACDPPRLIERCIAEETRAGLATVVRSQRRDVPIGARASAIDRERATTVLAPNVRAALLTAAEDALERAAAPARVQLGDVEAFVEVITPPPHLFVFGSWHDVSPLLALAAPLGWSVSIWDAQPRISARERLRSADHYLRGDLDEAIARLDRCVDGAAVVMSHDLAQDERVLAGLLTCRVRYIGVLGPRQRTQRMLAACAARIGPITPERAARVYAPVGLAIGAQSPAEIALAILSEAQAVLHGAPVQSSRDAPAPHPGAKR
jgi:xanthine/CO dehydrogenase XdhC/CoxF family maturation factor